MGETRINVQFGRNSCLFPHLIHDEGAVSQRIHAASLEVRLRHVAAEIWRHNGVGKVAFRIRLIFCCHTISLSCNDSFVITGA
nr:uncharacterized protein CTRU02_04361 [Colletotrichum truncatum]KAF6795551.1 hypothetical protein CTRU02_04361 [Colletotrichum truncatum]